MLEVESYYKEPSFSDRSFTVGCSWCISVMNHTVCKINCKIN